MKSFRFACILLLVIVNAGAAQNKPKNIIILIGDGMGSSYVSASVLSLENDPYRRFTSSGFSVTCSADKLITDSAASATAISTGHKTNNHYIAVDLDKKPLLTIMEHAESLGMSTGIVSTSSVTHATPASFVAHEDERSSEFEIAKDFLDLDLDVVIGGGSDFFLPKIKGGNRPDQRDLVEELKTNGYNFFNDEDDLLKALPGSKFYALLEGGSLPKACNRDYSLGQLTNAALDELSRNDKGFVLMIEGSQIDWAGHDNKEDYLLSELKDFNSAINAALDFAEKNFSTLVLVTADHETGGMAIVNGSADGEDIELKFALKGHTAEMVPVFTKGPGEELFRGVLDNFMIGRKLFYLVDEKFIF